MDLLKQIFEAGLQQGIERGLAMPQLMKFKREEEQKEASMSQQMGAVPPMGRTPTPGAGPTAGVTSLFGEG